MSNNNYIIRNAEEKDLDFMIELARQEGWNPGLNDKKSFYAADPNGFFIGELDGNPIGCVSGVKYEDKFAFGGFYIVKEEYRNMDYGIKMYNHVIEYADGLTFGIDGVVAQQENYKKSGFVFCYNQNRYEGTGLKGKLQSECLEIKNISLYDLVHFDKEIFRADRGAFLKEWIAMPQSYGLAITDNSLVRAYGVIRECYKGYKIGPIFAEEKSMAEKIFLSLVEFAEGKEVYLDIPELNKEAMAIQEKYNMKYVFETARMYKDGKVDVPVEKIFGVTSFELG